MARVVIEHLTKSFHGPKGELVRAVDDLSLTVEDRELLVLVGPSGCGKTTTLRLLAGLEEPDTGELALGEKQMNDAPAKDRDIAMVFQNHALYPHLSAFENMAFGLRLRKVGQTEVSRRVKEAADILELADCLDRKPAALSGGQRQRVALGRAIVRNPRLFLFDEPLSNLDPPLRLQMRVELSRLLHRLNATTLYVTHDQVEAMTLGDRVAVMKAGVLQQVAEPLTLYRQPANLFVAGFIGSPPMNFLRGTLVNSDQALWFQETAGDSHAASGQLRLRLDESTSARLQALAGKPVVLGIRPEHVVPLSLAETPSRPTVEATAELVEPLGAETYVHFSNGARPFIARAQGGTTLKVNDRVPLVFEMSHAHFFEPGTERAL